MPFAQVRLSDICSYLASLTKKFGTKLNLMNSKSRLYFVKYQSFYGGKKYIVKRPVEMRLAFGKYDLNFSAKEAKRTAEGVELTTICV